MKEEQHWEVQEVDSIVWKNKSRETTWNQKMKEFLSKSWLAMRQEFSTLFSKKESTMFTLSEVTEPIEACPFCVKKWRRETFRFASLVFQKLSTMTFQSLTNPSVSKLQFLKVSKPSDQLTLKVSVSITVWVWSDWWVEMPVLLQCKLPTAVEMLMFASFLSFSSVLFNLMSDLEGKFGVLEYIYQQLKIKKHLVIVVA